MSRVSFLLLSRLFIIVALCLSANTFAGEEKVSLNFVNADIDEVVRAVSHITGKNFLLDPRVKGTINIVSATPIPASLAYDTLLSALRMQGFAAVESGGVTKVMPEADAKLHLSDSYDAKNGGDKLVTRVYILKNESSVQMVPILRPLIAPNNIVVAYPNNNALVVTDYASNIKRIEQIIASIDQSSVEGPVIIPVKYSSALDLATTVSRLMQDGSVVGSGSTDASQRFTLVADSRSNSLLLRTDSPARVMRVRDLIAKLDVPGTTPGNMHVVYLKNAEAVKIAETLRAVISGDSSALSTATTSSSMAPTAASTGTGAASPATGASSSFASSSTSSASKSGSSGGGIIQADVASNALIITAPDAIYNNLRAVVEMLDVRRAQVYIEALIAEVTSDKTGEFGVQWQALNGINGTGNQLIGGTNFGTGAGNILTTAANLGTVGQGLNVGVVNGTTTIPGVGTVLNMGALAKFVQNDNKANILSTPNLLTLDNEEAKIVVGENVPFITGSYATTGSSTTASPFQTVERKDVGLTLRIKPTILEGGTVKLQIYQEVSSVNSLTNAAGIITNTRSLESIVLVDEGHVVVLGGLIQDSVSMQEDKVPLLGDIPWLGNLFRHEVRQQTKTNLMIFIRPYVLRTVSSPDAVTQDRYDYLRGAQKDSQLSSRTVLPDMSAPVLPPLSLKSDPPLSPKTESDLKPSSSKRETDVNSSSTPNP
jgi:general secretion pathway protein D